MAMDGVSVPINEKFKLPSGAETMAPRQSGVAGVDIKCRCHLTYSTKQAKSDKDQGRIFKLCIADEQSWIGDEEIPEEETTG